MGQSLRVTARHPDEIPARVGEVPGVEEQADWLAADLHQPLDLFFRLHHGSDVVVVRESEPTPANILGNLREAFAEPRPLVRGKRGSARPRHRALSVHAAALLCEHHDAAAHLFQQGPGCASGSRTTTTGLLRRRLTISSVCSAT